MRDLTKGSEARVILDFALPMLIGNIFQQLYTTVDSVVVGRGVGKEALAAVGASFPIMFLLISLVMGVTMGASIMLSQYFGARDLVRLKKTIDTSLLFLAAAALAVTLAGLLLCGPILRLVRTPPAVFPLARQYLQIMFAGMLFLFGYNTVSAILRGLGDSRNPLYFLIVATLLNIVLDVLFVIGFGWGVAGAAWATVISQGVSLLLGVLYMQRSPHEFLHVRLRRGPLRPGDLPHHAAHRAAQRGAALAGRAGVRRPEPDRESLRDRRVRRLHRRRRGWTPSPPCRP